MYDDNGIKNVEEVGAIAYKALAKAKEMAKPGAKLIDIAGAVEEFVKERGFLPAFPLNLSVNSEAAHYTPSMDDERALDEEDILKIDFGAAKDGFLSDCAVCVDFSGTHGNLIEGVEDALSAAISMIKAGVRTSDIGREIEKVITAKGGKPIKNLGGHGIERHNLHSDPFIPNFNDGSDAVLEEGMVVAVEPFATDGRGLVTEGSTCEIYQFAEEAGVRQQTARQLMAEIARSYRDEPFAVRWLAGTAQSKFSLYAAIQELVRAGVIEPHPTLVEIGNGFVAQAEAMVVVEKDGCRILTK